MTIRRSDGEIYHSDFRQLGKFLQPGDLLVFNSSRTLPASILGHEALTGTQIEVRLAEHLPDDSWLALLVCPRGEPFACGLREGITINFALGLRTKVGNRSERIPRLWRITFSKSGTELMSLLYRLGKPIRYEHTSLHWDLDYYQNIYSREPGSAEMPSAGRPFTWKALFDLKKQGIRMAYVVLHAGLSSYLDDDLDAKHPISEEEYFISPSAAEEVNVAHERGKRVIAVGTTVVRALETVTDETGTLHPGHGYTQLRITSDHPLRTVDALLTGLHEPEASHLDLLSAFVSPQLIQDAYEQAIRLGYLWHEFGDLNLII
jgi:S-adenosylmethionine:tRNA ribosyltransferase-isomerase